MVSLLTANPRPFLSRNEARTHATENAAQRHETHNTHVPAAEAILPKLATTRCDCNAHRAPSLERRHLLTACLTRPHVFARKEAPYFRSQAKNIMRNSNCCTPLASSLLQLYYHAHLYGTFHDSHDIPEFHEYDASSIRNAMIPIRS